MSSGCSAEALKQVPDNITLKWERGEEFKCRKEPCFKAVLKSTNDEEVAALPTRSYSFLIDKSHNSETFKFFSKDSFNIDEFVVERNNLFLKVEKDILGKFRLAFCDKNGNEIRSKYDNKNDVEINNIIGDIDFEKYSNINVPQIQVAPHGIPSCNKVYQAVLYDVTHKYPYPIGKFGEVIAYYVNDEPSINYSSICGRAFSGREPTVIVNKINDQYKLSVLDSNGFIKLQVEDLNVNHDILNKVMDEALCNQIEMSNAEKEKLCKELDDSSMMLSEQHHPCVSELAKANFAIEPATYEIDTYM